MELKDIIISAETLPRLELEQLKYTRVYQALYSHAWNRTKAAEELGCSVRAVRYFINKMKLQGVEVPQSIR